MFRNNITDGWITMFVCFQGRGRMSQPRKLLELYFTFLNDLWRQWRSWSSLLSGALILRFWRQWNVELEFLENWVCLKVLVQISGTVEKLELPIVRSAYPEVLETMERGVRIPGELSLLKVLVQVSSRRGRWSFLIWSWWLTDASVFLSPFYNILELGV